MEKETNEMRAEEAKIAGEEVKAAEEAKIAGEEVKTAGEANLPDRDKPKTVKHPRLRILFSWFLLTVGSIMMAVSVYFFQTANNFTLGGVAGIAILLSNYVPLSQGLLMIIINVALLVIGLILLGKQCTIRTIYCSLLYSGIIWIFEHFDLVGLISGGNATLTNQPFLELVYAILLFGIGGALIFNNNASSGGTDIIALILKKFTKLDVGISLMIIDFIIVCISFYAFDSLETALFSLMGLFARTVILDSVIESIGKTKYITIITTHPELISEFILQVINHGYTMYDAEGGYTGEKKKVMVTVCKRGEALKLKTKVKQTDPSAFVIITDANEILGKGFGGTI